MGRTFKSLHLPSVSQLQLKHETAPCLGPVWSEHSTVQLYPDREGSNAAGSPSLHLLFHHFSPVPPPPLIHMMRGALRTQAFLHWAAQLSNNGFCSQMYAALAEKN